MWAPAFPKPGSHQFGVIGGDGGSDGGEDGDELVDCPTQLICTWIFIC